MPVEEEDDNSTTGYVVAGLLGAAVLGGVVWAATRSKGAPSSSTALTPQVSLAALPDSLAPGGVAALAATATPVDAALVWTSSDESVASVNDAGIVTAHAVGTATITVALEAHPSVSSSTPVEVVSFLSDLPQVQLMLGVEVVAPTGTITRGDIFQLEAATTPPGNELTWASSDDAVASVDDSGVVTAHAQGSVSITASIKGLPQYSSSVPVTVEGGVGVVSTFTGLKPMKDSYLEHLWGDLPALYGSNISATLSEHVGGQAQQLPAFVPVGYGTSFFSILQKLDSSLSGPQRVEWAKQISAVPHNKYLYGSHWVPDDWSLLTGEDTVGAAFRKLNFNADKMYRNAQMPLRRIVPMDETTAGAVPEVLEEYTLPLGADASYDYGLLWIPVFNAQESGIPSELDACKANDCEY